MTRREWDSLQQSIREARVAMQWLADDLAGICARLPRDDDAGIELGAMRTTVGELLNTLDDLRDGAPGEAP